MDQNFENGGTIAYGDSYLEFVFCHSIVFRLVAIPNDAAEAMRSNIGKGPGNCYMIARGSNSRSLDHVTEAPFCFYVNLFLPSICNFVDF